MSNPFRRSPAVRVATSMTALALALSACTSATEEKKATGAGTTTGEQGTVYDQTAVHSFAVEVDQADLDAMLTTYRKSGDKEWIEAEVTIDGEKFSRVGLRLKGNSSLRSASPDSEAAELPWLIDLDKYVDGQDLDGYDEFVVRSSNTETSLNEAVALDLLEAAGLASEHAVATRFSVNGSDEELRLVVQNLDGDWDAENFTGEGIVYKAEAGGDYSYRGDDPASYEDVFDQETGAEDDLEPLIGFLEFINESTDAEFAAELEEHLDVESFATYLAFEELVGNFDDIDGPGNNSYLRWSEETGEFTVVAWDHNMAFGTGMGGPGRGMPGGERPEGLEPGERPEGMEPPAGFDPDDLPEGFEPPAGFDPDDLPEGFEPGQRPGGKGSMGGRNVLVERFQANAEFQALYEKALADLQASLVDNGTAQETLDTWVALLEDEAGDLVDSKTLTQEAESIEAALSGDSEDAS